MTNKLICYYSVLRFAAYRETDEFANVGVILACPAVGFLDYRVEAKRWARISHFFPEMGISIFRDSLRSFRATLDRFSTTPDLKQGINDVEQRRIKDCFAELVRPRETILYFSDVRVMRTENPPMALDTLFADYVDRRFAKTAEYRETVMRRNLAALLDENKLLDRYAKDSRIGNNIFNVKIPFVRFVPSDDGARPAAAIKPLDLDKDDSTSIIRHADAWKANVMRLREFNAAPAQILFTVSAPSGGGAKKDAFNHVVEEFVRMGIQVASENDEDQVLDFARTA